MTDAAVLDTRFAELRSALEADGPDASVPGASKDGPWAVLTAGRHGRFLTRCDREHAERVAAANIHEGWQPVAVFDLRALAGEPPRPREGDRVRYEDRHFDETEWWVVETTSDIADGELFTRVCLSTDPNASPYDPPPPWSATKLVEDVDEAEVEILRAAEPDDRLPLRYDVAGVEIVVAFNTVAS